MCKVPYALLALSLAAIATTSALAQPKPESSAAAPYQVKQTFHVGGEGGCDYITIDPMTKLLYVPRSTHTMVLNAATGKTVADIPGQKGCHGVVLVPEVGRGFISDGEDASVTIFDIKTHKVLGKVKAADDADAISYDPASRKVLVDCADAGVMVPIPANVDPKTGKADAAVELGGNPEFLTADGHGRVYVNLEDKNEVAVVDTKTMKVIDRWPVAPGGEPVAMAIDREHHRLFLGCREPAKLIVMNADDGKVIADLPIGVGVDAIRFDNGYVFASCRDGTLTIAREASKGKFEIVQTLQTRLGAKTLDVDPTTHTLYLPTLEFEKPADAHARPAPKPDSFMVLVVEPVRQ